MSEYPVVKLRNKSQITVPKEIMEKYDLSEGDKLEFIPEKDGIKIRPVITVPKSQAWFWNEKWQEGEKEADEDIKNDRVNGPYDFAEKLMEEIENE